jgi:hypothetical protein
VGGRALGRGLRAGQQNQAAQDNRAADELLRRGEHAEECEGVDRDEDRAERANDAGFRQGDVLEGVEEQELRAEGSDRRPKRKHQQVRPREDRPERAGGEGEYQDEQRDRATYLPSRNPKAPTMAAVSDRAMPLACAAPVA